MPSKNKKGVVAPSARHQINKPLNKYPPEIQQLIKKAGGKVARAAKLCGHSTAYWLNKFAGGVPFDDASKEIVKRALAGEVVSVAPRSGSAARTALVITKTNKFEQLYDVAHSLGGQWPFKRRAGADFIGVLVMPGNDLDAFIILAKAKGAEIFVT